MKIKEIIVDVKRSKNYQTYGCSEVITIEEGDNVEQLKKEAFERCNVNCEAQMEEPLPEPKEVNYNLTKG